MLEKAFWLVIGTSFVATYILGRHMLLVQARVNFTHDKRGKIIFLASGVVVGLLSIYPSLIAAFVIGYPIGMIAGDRIGRILGNADIGVQVGFLCGLSATIVTVILFGVIAGGWFGKGINHWRRNHVRPNQAL